MRSGIVLSKFKKILLFYHTIRHLKLRQVIWRIIYRFTQVKPDFSSTPNLRKAANSWTKPAARSPSMIAENKFIFLNREGTLVSAIDWQKNHPKLWLYNLHYFDDLNAFDSFNRQIWHESLINRWVKENKPGEGEGWEPYPLSIRIINWIKWSLSGNDLGKKAIDSLAIQVRWLTKRLEYHLLGNHLFINAKALVFAGCFFEGEEAKRWFSLGMSILKQEINEQILPDGGHFERSTMYHALAFEDMLDLINLSRTFNSVFTPNKSSLPIWPDIAKKMGHWLLTMCHPDGEISFFNDAAIGISPSPSKLLLYAQSLDINCSNQISDQIIWLKESGYIRITIDNIVLIIDVAQIGPDYLPGHAHADTLSYELSIAGHRFVVNSGTSQYGLGPIRQWERSTAAHSTVEINQESSSEVWAGFRVARRAYPIDIKISHDNNRILVSASHNGYQRLPGKPIHKRIWTVKKNHLIVEDQITGGFSQAVSRTYFSPSTKLIFSECNGTAEANGHKINLNTIGGKAWLKQSIFTPEFGTEVPNCCLEALFDSSQLIFNIRWSNNDSQIEQTKEM